MQNTSESPAAVEPRTYLNYKFARKDRNAVTEQANTSALGSSMNQNTTSTSAAQAGHASTQTVLQGPANDTVRFRVPAQPVDGVAKSLPGQFLSEEKSDPATFLAEWTPERLLAEPSNENGIEVVFGEAHVQTDADAFPEIWERLVTSPLTSQWFEASFGEI